MQTLDEIHGFNSPLTDKIRGFISWSFNETRDSLPRPIDEIPVLFQPLTAANHNIFGNRLMRFAFFATG